jgi:hypothetical protein
MCPRNLKRSKTKDCVTLGVRIKIFLAARVPVCHLGQKGHTRGRVQRMVYKVLVCVEMDPFF